jgi:hypothetical protein
VLQIAQEYKLDYDVSRKLLISKGWNYANAIADLKEKERRENLVIKFFSDNPSLDSMEQARSVLM